jgi:hypothetical protein
LSISIHVPDNWNSGKLSAIIVSLDWELNGLFTSNFATSFLSTAEEPIAVFAVLNSFSWLNMALPFGQKTGLLSFILSQYATVNREFDITLGDGSSAHLYSISITLEQLRKLKAPIGNALDVEFITIEQQGSTYMIVYATELGKMSQYQATFENILSSVNIGTVHFSAPRNPLS